MVNISRRQLPEEFLNKIFELFFKKEKILFAKRITIIYLLLKKIEQSNIADFLKVSTSTVCKYALLIENKNSEMIKIMKFLIKKEKIFDFMNELFASFFIQPGVKIGHWQLYWDHKRKKDRKELYGM